MKNLINFFFSFDKLFKEKLIFPFFLLSLLVIGLAFLEEAFRAIKLPPLGAVVGFVNFWALLLLSFITIRIIAELMVAIFRINDNLSPDKGKSAEIAAARTREATKTVSEKASAATKSMRENVDEMTDTVQDKATAATASVRSKADGLAPGPKEKQKPVADKPAPKPAVKKPESATGTASKAKPAAPKAVKTDAPKRRGRPPGTKNKPTAAKPGPKKKASGVKRGPKPGVKVPRDEFGNLLKKDGTPRKKPGPKSS